MSCLPETGGCERYRTDPFVAHLNQAEGSRFVHRACLDQLHRNSAQPEALYSDTDDGAELVIECKAVVWPPDYAARHRNDHFIANVLSKQLRDIADDLPLSIDLQPAPRMTRDEMLSCTREISDNIRANINLICEERVLGSRETHLCWSCRLDPKDRLDFNDPPNGVVVRWSERELPYDLPEKLADQIKRLFRATIIKFRYYPKARRILLLDPYGSIRYTDDWWWARALKTVPVPSEITEVWLAQFDWVTGFDQDWIFQRLDTLRPDLRAT